MPQRRPFVGFEAGSSPHSRHFQGGFPSELRRNRDWTTGLVKGMPRLGEGAQRGRPARKLRAASASSGRVGTRGSRRALPGNQFPKLRHHLPHALRNRHGRDEQSGLPLEEARADLVVYGFTLVLTSPSARGLFLPEQSWSLPG
jgi:hypothetical protein